MFDIVTKVNTGGTLDDDDMVMGNKFAKEDSVVAGQSVQLTITAGDANLNDRPAVAYRKSVMVVAMDSDGKKMPSVSFSGNKGEVSDNGDGSAMLAGSGWSVGVFSGVLVKATTAGDLTIAVKELDANGDAVVTGTADIHVDAANFAGFNIAILENNQPVDDIRGAFQLSVKPADKFRNVSAKAYKGAAVADTLDLLDSRMPDDTTLSYDSGIYASIASWPVLAQLPPPTPIFSVPVLERGRTFGIPEAPVGETLWISVEVVNGRLDSDDMLSKDAASSATFDIKSALMPMLTLWVPGSTDDEAGNKVVIPADADDIMVT